MKLVEEINLPNGLKLIIEDLSRDIAADTVKVELVFKTAVDLTESLFSHQPDYKLVKNICGSKLFYEHKMERTFVSKENRDAVREELIATFKKNSLCYLGIENFAVKLAAAKLRDIKRNPYKYRDIKDNET